ncbi:MarR family winged helix-turn-helix transcriptional regulator [Rhizobiaceae bacterium BDR2-2]|uniref:MarR family winged helix-turn-helix transcriptional regulator n=1 Tax=Ectorhizobium quercum TaxID=2965071 RepID=A0AAE3N3B3_9HYPH|nr:MarR family winged helix-turn-helix transcriptional regulator [Ectorhizobium quercum]MCX8998535.1 MarR family winged helix-turn-helix transcriptional regulator [Ectorhizobium quercum]
MTKRCDDDGQATEAAIEAISRTISRLRVLIGRRIISRLALANVTPGLELSHVDVLDAIRRIDGEATVGAIAEQLRIDPSRGSRLVADMVAGGVLYRLASQEDGRRSVIELTELGERLLKEMRDIKDSVIRQAVADWPEEDIEVFAALYARFVCRFDALLTDNQRRAEGCRSKGGPAP